MQKSMEWIAEFRWVNFGPCRNCICKALLACTGAETENLILRCARAHANCDLRKSIDLKS
jgi:hypothetical protein